MARWRKVDVRLWNDRKFRSLSEDGRMLWLYLVTCPETTAIPGIVMTGRGAICDALEWSPERFAEPFQELVSKGMAEADFEARLVWLPNAIKYNPPANGNVVKGWADQWDEVPECDLKHKAWRVLKQYTERFAEQFAKACPEPFANGMPTQEQEQEQEQERGESSPAEPAPLALVPEEPGGSVAAKARALDRAGIEELRTATGERRQFGTKTSLELCEKLAKDGRTPEQMRDVVRAKAKQWLRDPKMREQLKPSVLFQRKKFGKYLDEDVPAMQPRRRAPKEAADAPIL